MEYPALGQTRIAFVGLLLVFTVVAWADEPLSGDARESRAAITIPELSERDYVSSLRLIGELGQFEGYRSYAVEYDSDGLRLRAVLNTPVSEMPEKGYPVIVMNHGNALAAGNDFFRDYYSTDQESQDYTKLIRSNPLTRFAREGFAVFQPDYRGHGYSETHGKHDGYWQLDRHGERALNRFGKPVPRVMDDDGLRFNGFLYSAYYTIDVLNLLAAMQVFENPPPNLRLDLDNLFMWGRSLGGDVTARVIACTDMVRAASLWVPATTSLWDQAHHYHFDSPHYADGLAMETLLVELQTHNEVIGGELVTRDLVPNNFLDQVSAPVIVQVSMEDEGVRSAWGIQYHYELLEYGVESELRIYPGKDHVFRGDTLEQAIQADLAFFRAHMR